MQTLFEGFAAEIAALRLDLDHSLDENRRSLLAHFLGLGYRRQPSQALAGVSMEQPGGIDERLDLRGHTTRMPTEETLKFRLPGSVRLPRMSIGGAAYTGPRGLVLLDADPKAPQRTLEPIHVGEIDSPGPPTFHIGLRGTPPRAGELLTLAFIPPQESHFRLYPQQSRDLSDYRRWICGSSMHAAGGVLAPPRRMDELVAEESLDGAVSDRLPTRRAAFRVLLEQHVYADLIFGWSGPLTDVLAVGPPPEQLLRQARQLCPDSARAWGNDLRWVSLRLAGLPGDDPLRLFHRIAVNVVPILAYEILEPDRQNVSMENVSPVTGVLPIPLTPETHAILQHNDWLIDRVESTGEIFPHVHEHPDPDGYWYGLLSDWCSSALYVHLPAVRPRSIGPVDLYLGRLVGSRANGAVLDPFPYNRSEFPGLDVLWQLTEFVGGTEGHAGDTDVPWEGIGSFLRTRDRLVTRWTTRASCGALTRGSAAASFAMSPWPGKGVSCRASLSWCSSTSRSASPERIWPCLSSPCSAS